MGGNFGNFNNFGNNFSTSKSVSKQTFIKNGKWTSITTTVITKPDGTKVEEKLEEIDDGSGNIIKKKYVNGKP